MISTRWLCALFAALLLHGVALALWTTRPAQENQLPPGEGIGLDAGSGTVDALPAVPESVALDLTQLLTGAVAAAQAPASVRAQGSRGGGHSYLGRVRAHLNAYRTALPADLSARGIVQVRFVVDLEGRVSQLQLARSSGSAALDQQALALVARASPLPAPSERRALRLVVPVEFSAE